jgi:hypothetical protein
MRPKGRVAAGALAALRAVTAPERNDMRETLGAQRRKAKRPPPLMRGKPRQTDVRRPVSEGENKKALPTGEGFLR